MGTVYNTNVVTDGLVACWDAGNRKSYPGAGTTWTDVAGGNNGTVENDASFDSDNMGSLDFDGTDAYVTVPYKAGFDVVAVTLLAWVNIDGDNSGYDDIFRKNYDISGAHFSHSYGAQITPAGRFHFNIRVSSGTSALDSSLDVSDATWTFLGGTYDGTTIRSYKNNEVGSTSTSVSGDLVADTENALIASTQRTNEDARPEYKGKIALIQIYNRALTAAEVLQNYNATKGRFT
jgi:hypothetical protein